MLSSFCSPLNSIPDIPGIISVVTAGIILVAGIISAVIGGHFGGGAVLFHQVIYSLECRVDNNRIRINLKSTVVLQRLF